MAASSRHVLSCLAERVIAPGARPELRWIMARSLEGGRHGTVTPMPAQGEVIVGRDVAGRVLRMSSHPEIDRVVLSIWQGGQCLATFRIAPDDVPGLVAALISTALPTPAPESATGTYGTPV